MKKVVIAAEEENDQKDAKGTKDNAKGDKKPDKVVPHFRMSQVPALNEATVSAELTKAIVSPIFTLLADIIESIQGQVSKESMERVLQNIEKIKLQIAKKARPIAKELTVMLSTGLGKVKLSR
jgi:hypothetical protein